MQEETEICLGLVPLTETLNGQYIHPMADSLPSRPIPVNDGSTNSIPQQVPTPVLHGSRQNINRSQPNLSQSGFQQDYPPPYPGNMPYPTDNKLRNSTGEIGFRTPPRVSVADVPYPAPAEKNPPYPSANLMPGGVTPYPTGHAMPGGSPYPHPPINSSQGVSSYPHPPINSSQGVSPYPHPPGNSSQGVSPYPPGNSPRSASPPYPQANNGGLPTYAQAGFAPSAPPATE